MPFLHGRNGQDRGKNSLDYETKHLGLQSFVHDVVSSVNYTELSAFLELGFSERQLVSQYQRSYNKLMVPKELQRYPQRPSRRWIEKLKLALRDVTADWEALLQMLESMRQNEQRKNIVCQSLKIYAKCVLKGA